MRWTLDELTVARDESGLDFYAGPGDAWGRVYFAFLESIEDVPGEGVPGRGDGFTAVIRSYACVGVEDLRSLMDHIDPIDPEQPTLRARRRRARLLRKHLVSLQFPVMRVRLQRPAQAETDVLGPPRSWSVLAIGPNQPTELGIPVVEMDPEIGQPLREVGFIVAHARVSEGWLYPLQNIFSLAHVPDAPTGGDGGRAVEPPPAIPPGARAQIIHWPSRGRRGRRS